MSDVTTSEDITIWGLIICSYIETGWWSFALASVALILISRSIFIGVKE